MSRQAQRRVSSLARVVLSVLVIAGALLIFQNRGYLQDQFIASRYVPDTEMAAIIDRIAPTDHGRLLIYASQTELLPRESFNDACRTASSDETAVLGCYVNNRIFLFDIDDEKLDGIKEVTTAHEMLHAAYQRLSVAERERIDGLLEAQSFGADEDRINELLAQYAESEPGERLNELHSILGSELRALSPELEEYYAQFFEDRRKLVALADQYQAVFSELKGRQESIVTGLEALGDEIDRAGSVYKRNQQVLVSDIAAFNARASSGQMSPSAYSSERTQLEARQANLQAEYTRIQGLVAAYEKQRGELATINSESSSLNRSINSSLTPVPEVQ